MAWRDSVGFADRLQLINRFTEALQTSDENLSRSAALQEARQEETACWDNASAKAEYLSLSENRLSQLLIKRTTPHAPSSTEQPCTLPPGVPECIGPFTSAVHINIGLFSTIFCAPAPSEYKSSKLIALKVTNLSSIAPPHDPIREARLLKLARHPSVLPLLDTLHLPGEFILITPYFSTSLSELLKSGPINIISARSIMSDMFTGLAHIHSLGIIHRDIKPSNILLNFPSLGAVIADFGISWHEKDPSSEPVTEKITDIGTTHYRAPELLFGYRSYGPEIDLWGAGCVLAETIDVGHRPLFESGDLGSELRLVADIFQKLGTPTLDTWPAAKEFPDFGKLEFKVFQRQAWENLVFCPDAAALDVVSKLVTYEAADRLPACKVLEQQFFRNKTA